LQKFGRRNFILTAAAAVLAAIVPGGPMRAEQKMFGLIGNMKAVPGKRDELVPILLKGVGDMPGCLSYVVAKDPTDSDKIWITEVWDSQASHAASLTLPSVRQAIAQGKPLIASFGDSTVTEPVGGHGLFMKK
jgi:quinol monooxygenase YgiN